MLSSFVIDSGNGGKVREIRAAFAEHPSLVIRDQNELNIAAAAEPHATFVENALTKARHAAAVAGRPALADDSGLVVAALDGAPGVYSARYAGAGADDGKNNDKLLAAMRGRRQRDAYYYAAIVFVLSAADPAPIVADGFWRGEILRDKRGDGGFGYDQLFYDPAVGKSGAEMTPAEKQQVSHRGQSLRRVIQQLRWRLLLPPPA